MFALLLAVASLPAEAAAPVAWSWPAGTPLLYHLETQLLTPRTVRYYAAKNLDAIAVGIQLGSDATCTAKEEGKGWRVRCDLTWFRIAGRAAMPDDQEKLDRILEEWSRDLTGADVEWYQTKDGRLREFDLFRAEQRTRTEGYVIESQRMVLQRMFSIFDLPLSTKDEDWIRGWKQKESALMQLQVISGTVGASVIDHKRTADEWGFVAIETSGRGTLSPGGAVDSSGTKLIDVRVGGEALFDPTNGQLVYRDVALDGRLTASSHETGRDAEVFQAGAVQRVAAFGPDGEPPLPLSAQMAPKVDAEPPAPPEGIAVVPFAELGMNSFFVQGMPESAKSLQLPKNQVRARVVVGTDGAPTSVTVTRGYAALAVPTENALRAAKFPVRPAPYAVDVDVEWRP